MQNFPRMLRLIILFVILAVFGVSCKKHSHWAGDDLAGLETVVGTMTARPIDSTKPVHIVVIGYADGLGNGLVQSAITRAGRYQTLNAEAQVVFLAKPEVRASVTDRQAIERLGVKVLSDDATALDGTRLFAEMKKYSNIASFDYYGHSTPWSINTSSFDSRWSVQNNPDFGSLRGHFGESAYATLSGCNAGVVLAQVLARAWGIPVSGAWTGSLFERLWSDGNWYVADDRSHPRSGAWAEQNAVSFVAGRDCANRLGGGYCLRLRPQNAPYSGYWGKYFGSGLGFFKTFCYLQQEECERRMAIGLFSFPSVKALVPDSPVGDFESVVFDFLCPQSPDGSARRACIAGIREAVSRKDMRFDAFPRRSVDCTLHDCNSRLVKDEATSKERGRDAFRIELTDDQPSRSLSREYAHYMRGYHAIWGYPIPVALRDLHLGSTQPPPALP